LSGQYERRFRQLADQPALVTTTPLAGGEPVEVLLDGKRLAAALETAMQVSARLGQVPGAILTASNELSAATAINDEVNLFTAEGSSASVALSYGCSYDLRLNRVGELSETTSPRFAGASEPTFRKICEAWGVPSVWDSVAQPLTAPVPVFVAQSGFSTAGVNDWSTKLTANGPGATVMRFPTMSEDLIFVAPECLREARRAFIADPSADVDTAPCEGPPIQFG